MTVYTLIEEIDISQAFMEILGFGSGSRDLVAAGGYPRHADCD